ncbi:hypothetical protein RJ639_012905 [Escallonia herrerae]|uniref:Uncharacterized protein n=1 Tax=Escallonia herrerae TaxID=1293975 RepID=A0AA88VPU0_9ASTE|nr:hypothetical protein RJ639_012905 [Escallonia herrerae]
MGKKVVWSLKKVSKEVWPWKKISSGGFKLKRLKILLVWLNNGTIEYLEWEKIWSCWNGRRYGVHLD